jgi:hypothetical protein
VTTSKSTGGSTANPLDASSAIKRNVLSGQRPSSPTQLFLPKPDSLLPSRKTTSLLFTAANGSSGISKSGGAHFPSPAQRPLSAPSYGPADSGKAYDWPVGFDIMSLSKSASRVSMCLRSVSRTILPAKRLTVSAALMAFCLAWTSCSKCPALLDSLADCMNVQPSAISILRKSTRFCCELARISSRSASIQCTSHYRLAPSGALNSVDYCMKHIPPRFDQTCLAG